MDFLSVRQAAGALAVDESRVRQLLQEGKLQGVRVDGRWLVGAGSVQDRKRLPRSGRPLSPRNAWGALAILSGCRPSDLSAPERSRLLTRLRNLAAHGGALPTDDLQRLLSSRAESRRYRVHRGVLPALLEHPDVVRAGVSAAPRIGADYVAPGQAEVYVHPERLGTLEAEFGMMPDAEQGNLVVRVPPVSAWPFLQSGSGEHESQAGERGKDAPSSVVAADLLDAHEDRASVAAVGIIEPLLARPERIGSRAA
ncbi:hypothetical protein [Streptomyces sp.]|uniref:hypothetical protein n=1 Tax=Streptomyces sp. TaxID=1931 RepID=UPI002F40085C